MSTQPQPAPVLPWHHAAADEINKALLRQNPTVAAIIASHDPTPQTLVEKKIAHLQARHAETLRLLEEALVGLDCAAKYETTAFLGFVLIGDKIRAHLAAHGGGK